MTRDDARKIDLGALGLYGLFEDKHIDKLVEFLLNYKERGQSVYVELDGHKFYSADITLDSAYKEITGKTKKERENYLEMQRKEYENRREKALEKVPGWIERGKKLIDEDKWATWEKLVTTSANGVYLGEDVELILQFKEKIDLGTEREEMESFIKKHGLFSNHYIRGFIEFFWKDESQLWEKLFDNENSELEQKEGKKQRLEKRVDALDETLKLMGQKGKDKDKNSVGIGE